MQQVNLYVAELRPKKEWLTAASLLFLLIGFCALMLASVSINYYQLSQYEKQVVKLEGQKELSATRLVDIKKRMPKNVAGKLDKQVMSLRDKLNQKIQISEIVGGKNLGNSRGYSSHFDALAEKIPADVAISRFKLSGGVEKLEMMGESLKADEVASMVSALKSSPSFENTSFGQLTMRDKRSTSGRVYFSFGFTPVFDHHGTLVGKRQ